MFWIIMLIVGIVLVVLGSLSVFSDFEEGFLVSGFVILICSVFFLSIFGLVGIFNYPGLVEDYEEIKVYQHRMIDIKKAYYKSIPQSKLIVSGSIENFKQSTNLSKYISELAEKEANYNGDLKSSQLYKEEFVLWFFTCGLFISDKINELKPIEIK